jgi:hypothetical protein
MTGLLASPSPFATETPVPAISVLPTAVPPEIAGKPVTPLRSVIALRAEAVAVRVAPFS